MKPKLPLAPEFLQAHESKLKPLLDRFQSARALHSTLLFTGVEGVGKKSLVLHFIQLLFCDRSIFAKAGGQEEEANLFGDFSAPAPVETTGLVACNECKSCIRAKQDHWIDLFWFEPEMNEEGTRLGVHKIEPFRELKAKLGMGPSEEPFKIAVIAEADRMTPQAANSILKMLEEPPQNWMFILTASDSSRLLPTILSRCNEIKLSPLSSEQILTILKSTRGADYNSTREGIASRAALGSLTRAMSYLDEDVWKMRDQWLGFFSSPSHEWMKLIESLSAGQKDLHLALDLIESLFSDLLQAQVAGNSHVWIHEDQKAVLLQFAEAKNITPEKLIHVLETTAEKRRLVNLTLNSKLLAQEILIPILQIL